MRRRWHASLAWPYHTSPTGALLTFSVKRAISRVAVAHVDPAKVALAHDLHRRYPPDPAAATGAWQVIRTGQAELLAEISDDILAASIEDKVYLQIIRDLGLRSYIGVPLSIRGKTIGVLTFISAESRHIYNTADVDIAIEIGRRAGVAIDNSLLYRKLQENDRRKDEFLAMLGHELRNPLAPISAAAQLLSNHPAPVQVQRASAVIARQVAHMTGLVDDLLDVSRVTRGDVVIDREVIDLRTVIHCAIEQVRPLIKSKSQHLHVTLGETELAIEGDHKRLVQVMANLLNNAAKFTHPGGDIHVHSAYSSGMIRISVRDNGIGMPSELLSQAFDLFVQGDTTVDRSLGGLGLGLALVKHLIGLHGGTVAADSDGPDHGSAFTIDIPCALGTAADDMPAPAVTGPGRDPGSKRVLLVDDNVDAAVMLSMVLEADGYQVELAHHPFDALDQLANGAFDVVLLDIGLPELDGREVARRIRADAGGAGPLIIGVSGYGQESDLHSALAAGMDAYLIKPVDPSKLLNLLNTGAPRAARDGYAQQHE